MERRPESEHAVHQLERALGVWGLIVEEEPDEPRRLERIRRALRLKRFETPDLARRLPGCVRRGARIDLLPLLDRLHEAGVRAQLVQRTASPVSRSADAGSADSGSADAEAGDDAGA